MHGTHRSIPGHQFIASKDGSILVVTTPEAVDVYDASGRTKIASLPEPAAVLTALSPLNHYVVTVTKPVKDEKGQPGKNLKVWDLATGQLVQSVPQKQVSKDHWPAIHWAGDESALAHCVTNTVHLYKRADAFATYTRMTIKGVTGLAMSPASSEPELARLAAFVPEAKASPASCGVYDWTGEGPSEPQALVRKSFFRTSGAQLLWNKPGTALLAMAYTDFDVTNQSYYGEQKLHYLPSDPAKMDKACTVDLKDGPVHDVQWSPSGEHFAVVAGFIPSKVMLFDANCKPLYDFGSGPYNVVRWNPFGRFLVVAGFGNLPGDIIFYDRKASGTCKQMGAVRSPAVTAEWSPDGRSLLTAIVAPRLRVDNNYKVFSYYGQQVYTTPFPCLFEAAWLPAAPGTYQDRPQSPERLAAASAGPASAGPPKASGYVPPHLRAAGGGADAAAAGAPKPQFSLAFDANDKPGRVGAAGKFGMLKPPPPGADFAPSAKTVSKNAKKRANKKKGAGDGAGGDDAAADGEEGGAEGAAAAVAETEAATAGLSIQGDSPAAATSQGDSPAAATSAPPAAATTSAGDGAGAESKDEVAKRARALQKKLRQVTELKEKLQKEGSKALTPEQHQKIAGEAELLAQLQALGGSA